jgi:hypothetical protein
MIQPHQNVLLHDFSQSMRNYFRAVNLLSKMSAAEFLNPEDSSLDGSCVCDDVYVLTGAM